MTRTVTVIGDALIDELRDESGTSSFVGGAALNVAVGLSVLGVSATLVAMVGDDADGDTIRAFLDDHGVTLVDSPAPHGTSRAISDRTEGEPTYAFNLAARQRAIAFDGPTVDAISAADLVVVSCFPFDSDEQSAALATAVRSPATRLVIDPNPRAGMLADRGRFVHNFEALATDALLIKIGDDDARLLYNSSLASLTERLHETSSATILATAGRDGASIVDHRGHTADSPIASLPGPIVDTMGGGDATLASMTASLLETSQPAWQPALDRAMLIAAATCRHPGALLRLP
jgi:fructokinase